MTLGKIIAGGLLAAVGCGAYCYYCQQRNGTLFSFFDEEPQSLPFVGYPKSKIQLPSDRATRFIKEAGSVEMSPNIQDV